MLRNGSASATDLAWREGLEGWIPLGQILQPAMPPVPAPAPGRPTPLDDYGTAVPGTPASFGARLAAHVIDSILGLFGSIAAGVLTGAVWGLSGADADSAAPGFLGAAVGMLVGWLYYALMESSARQATLGKMALGIIVTDLEGRRISFGRASGRYFGMFLSNFTLLIGFLMCAWTEKKQCLHDMLAGCLVRKK